jgi:DNA-binding FadR family transcriptional regulator
MINYSELNKTQKRIVDALIELDPSLANARTITREHLEKLYWHLYAQRAHGGPKMGYPMWLSRGEKVARAEYLFPAPNVVHESKSLPKPKTQKQIRAELLKTEQERESEEAKTKSDEEFFRELEEAGVTV